jgi:hypothetical protein
VDDNSGQNYKTFFFVADEENKKARLFVACKQEQLG